LVTGRGFFLNGKGFFLSGKGFFLNGFVEASADESNKHVRINKKAKKQRQERELGRI
jgi:hypothetical protein